MSSHTEMKENSHFLTIITIKTVHTAMPNVSQIKHTLILFHMNELETVSTYADRK